MISFSATFDKDLFVKSPLTGKMLIELKTEDVYSSRYNNFLYTQGQLDSLSLIIHRQGRIYKLSFVFLHVLKAS